MQLTHRGDDTAKEQKRNKQCGTQTASYGRTRMCANDCTQTRIHTSTCTYVHACICTYSWLHQPQVESTTTTNTYMHTHVCNKRYITQLRTGRYIMIRHARICVARTTNSRQINRTRHTRTAQPTTWTGIHHAIDTQCCGSDV